MRYLITLLLFILLVACGKNGANGLNGQDGASILGLNAVSTGIDFEDIESGLVCSNGGVSIFTFRDINSDGLLQADESIIKVKAICHGTNGSNGSNGEDGRNSSLTLETFSASTQCPSGGVTIYATNSAPAMVCNGVNGINGEQGIPGVQGIPGLNGTNGADGTHGASVYPVKFCADDQSTFPEYGLMIGHELFAVYWGATPASPNTPQAFLTKLVPGQYRSTGGNNCLFKI